MVYSVVLQMMCTHITYPHKTWCMDFINNATHRINHNGGYLEWIYIMV